MLILECSQGCYGRTDGRTKGRTDELKDGRTDGSITISLRNFVGKGIIIVQFYRYRRTTRICRTGKCISLLTIDYTVVTSRGDCDFCTQCYNIYNNNNYNSQHYQGFRIPFVSMIYGSA
jgi:hypothetical protein